MKIIMRILAMGLFFSLFAASAQQPKIKYEVVRTGKDNRGLINQVFVYTLKMSDIKALNVVLVGKYKKPNSETLQIYYFDNKAAAKNYTRFLFSKNVSDNEMDKLRKHVIGKFEYTGFDNKQNLHIGRGADDY